MKLHYFDSPGKGEPIRLLLHHAKIPFDDYRIRVIDWPNLMTNYENHELPMLEWDGKKYYQTDSILEFLGIKYDYFISDPIKAYEMICIMNCFEDLLVKIFNAFSPFTPYPEEKLKSLKNELMKVEMPFILKFIESKISKNESEEYFVGEKYSLADFYALGFYANIKQYPDLMKAYNSVNDSPRLKNIIQLRSKDFAGFYGIPQQKLKLYYFDMPGRGEMIRLLLRKSKTPFEDIRIKFEEWPTMKERFSLKQLPVLEADGVQMPETEAIMQYLGMEHGYLPVDPEKHFKVLFIIGTTRDLIDGFTKFFFSSLPDDKKKSMAEQYYGQTVPLAFKILETRLKENETQEFFVGKKYTIADFHMLGVAKWIIFNPLIEGKISNLLTATPVLKTYLETRLKDF